jgi:hypothetical protein
VCVVRGDFKQSGSNSLWLRFVPVVCAGLCRVFVPSIVQIVAPITRLAGPLIVYIVERGDCRWRLFLWGCRCVFGCWN